MKLSALIETQGNKENRNRKAQSKRKKSRWQFFHDLKYSLTALCQEVFRHIIQISGSERSRHFTNQTYNYCYFEWVDFLLHKGSS